ncbi:Cysteine/Histidine-rich C1 domain family protein [Raphanus sativus]|nr:Cysteine/Histidine-rich C1 domain family protein [Raphanus sativus]
MDSDGGFHEVEKDGELFLVYHHPKYRPVPQIKSLSSAAEVANDDHPPLPIFICPYVRWQKEDPGNFRSFMIDSSPEFVLSSEASYNRHVLTLFWCNNETIDDNGKCGICSFASDCGTNYYFCAWCHSKYHKECVESPLKIKHPYYPHHSPLQLYYHKAHRVCAEFPHTIKISRHPHRISRVSSLRYEKWPCGVCRKSIDGNYGAYTCNQCGEYYAVHSKCALGTGVWDGEELKGVPEKDDIAQDAPPFSKISEGVVHYFLHEHHLRLEKNVLLDDENKFCEACLMPIIEDELYSCADECEFILHETCLKARRRIQHALHPHPLTLKANNNYVSSSSGQCTACSRTCGGFVYECPKHECSFKLDVRCALISEPFDYQGHEHPLFLSLDPYVHVLCKVCKWRQNYSLNCIKCDFIVCMECATLPYKVRYKNDKHFLTLSWGEEEERCEKYWCEECEDIVKNLFYWCNDCCTILHTHCLFSEDPYLKPGQVLLEVREKKEFQILPKSNTSRPICPFCKKPCQGKRFTRDKLIACSASCVSGMAYIRAREREF